MLVWRIPCDVMIKAEKPEGVLGFIHRKIMRINAVVIAGDTEQSISFYSGRLLSSICAFRTDNFLKKSCVYSFSYKDVSL